MGVAKKRLFHVILLVLAALLIVGVLTFAGPCVHEDGSAAVCQSAAHAVLFAGAASFACALAALLVHNAKASGVLAIAAACCGAFAAAAPGTLFGLCMMQTMRCWTVMQPFALVVGVAIAISGIAAAISVFVSKEGAYHESR